MRILWIAKWFPMIYLIITHIISLFQIKIADIVSQGLGIILNLVIILLVTLFFIKQKEMAKNIIGFGK